MELCFDDKMILIRKDDLLSQLREEDFESLNIEHNFIVAPKNDYIYFDAHFARKLYFIKEGCIRLGNVSDEGEELVKEILKPYDMFGQFTLERNNLHGEFAQAFKSDVALCAFDVDDFSRLLTRRPELSLEFSKKMGNRLRKVQSRLLNFLHRDVRTRLIHFFWTLTEDDTASSSMGTSIIENFVTHADIARLTGTSRQTVTTIINQLQCEGLLSFDKQSIVIHNMNLLQKLAKVG